MVDHASDDELFAGGYLRGHLTLAVAELEGEGGHSADAVHGRVSQSLRKPSALANCRRRTKFWCRGCGITCINRRKIRPEPCCSPVRRQPYPEIACPHGLFHRFSFSSFHPQPIRIQRRQGVAIQRQRFALIAPPAAQRLTARCKIRGPSAPSINKFTTDRRAIGDIRLLR